MEVKAQKCVTERIGRLYISLLIDENCTKELHCRMFVLDYDVCVETPSSSWYICFVFIAYFWSMS